MNTGIAPSQEVMDVYKQLKLGKLKILILKINEKSELEITFQADRSFDYKNIFEYLPTTEPRYVFYDFDYETDEVPPRKTTKLIMMSWIPLTAPAKLRFPYSSGTNSLIQTLGAIQKHFQVDDFAGVDYDTIRKACLK